MAAKIETFVSHFPVKFYWFLKNGYRPHGWQILFHFAATPDGRLNRFRHLVAGRRGGKTLSAAWDILFYCLHPEEFHRDAHGTESERPLWVWALAKDYKLGRPQLLTFLDVMAQSGLVKDKDYKYNKTEKVIEFPSGTLVEFKSADDPESLRGAGLDILWMDEAAFIPSPQAYRVIRPALSDKLGLVITTTTPAGKNWLWNEFFSGKALEDPKQFRVEYTTLDSPYIDKDEVAYARDNFHPSMFKQEYMASFDAFQGIELQGEWLHYYTVGQPDNPDDIRLPSPIEGKLPMRTYMGVDPAISLSDEADHFAMCLIGVTTDNSQAFVMDTFKGRLTFPDQLDKIKEWHLKYRPDMIGIEINAYQHALLQMSGRMEGMPPVVPVISKSKKSERILGMSPLFKIAKVRIHRLHNDFVEEWINYDSSVKNAKDDLLDATEIALGVAGILLPSMPLASHFTDRQSGSVEDEALMSIAASRAKRKGGRVDEELGVDF